MMSQTISTKGVFFFTGWANFLQDSFSFYNNFGLSLVALYWGTDIPENYTKNPKSSEAGRETEAEL